MARSTSSRSKAGHSIDLEDNDSSATTPRNDSEQPQPRDHDEDEDAETGEATGLLSGEPRDNIDSIQEEEPQPSKRSRKRWRWPSIIALTVLCIVVILIVVFAFIAPSAVRSYAEQAAEIKGIPSFALDSISKDNVTINVRVNGRLNADKVENGFTRNIGRFATSIGRKVHTDKSAVLIRVEGNKRGQDGDLAHVFLPDMELDVKNQVWNHIDVPCTIEPDDLGILKKLAQDALSGHLEELSLVAHAKVPLRIWGIGLGNQDVAQKVELKGSDVPSIPEFKVTRLNIHESTVPSQEKAMVVDVSIEVFNEYPFDLHVPSLPFTMLVPGCTPDERLTVAEVTTAAVHIKPKSTIEVNGQGLIRSLPHDITAACPQTGKSPLDALLNQYVHGKDAAVFIRGSDKPVPDLPSWISELLSSITVEVPFPGHSLDKVVKSFTLQNVNFKLPSPLAEPGTPASQPKISADVQAVVNLPAEMNFPLDVSKARADARVFYHDQHLGNLDLHKWQPANSTRQSGSNGTPELLVHSVVKDAPLNITDSDLFTEVIQSLLFGDKPITLGIAAAVDVAIHSAALGQFVVRDLPAEGKVHVKPLLAGGPGGALQAIDPRVYDLRLLTTSPQSISFGMRVNFTNPSEYEAEIPYLMAQWVVNGSRMGDVVVENANVRRGVNHGLQGQLRYHPLGEHAEDVGRRFLGMYLDGENTTLTIRPSPHSLPSQPELSHALRNVTITIPTPRLSPSDPEHHPQRNNTPTDHRPDFLLGVNFHLLSSSASFRLLSPLKDETLYLTAIHATAYYKDHPEPVGTIDYVSNGEAAADTTFNPIARIADWWRPDKGTYGDGDEIQVPPGESETVRVPVKFNLKSAGYEAIRKAIGGELKVRAVVEVGVRIGRWRMRDLGLVIEGIGADVRW